MKKKIGLPLTLSLAALAVTIAPAAGARAARVPEGQGRQQAEAGTRRRPVKRRKSVQVQESTYTCPMHNDVHSKSPGECPKCKMELELEQPGKAKSE